MDAGQSCSSIKINSQRSFLSGGQFRGDEHLPVKVNSPYSQMTSEDVSLAACSDEQSDVQTMSLSDMICEDSHDSGLQTRVSQVTDADDWNAKKCPDTPLCSDFDSELPDSKVEPSQPVLTPTENTSDQIGVGKTSNSRNDTQVSTKDMETVTAEREIPFEVPRPLTATAGSQGNSSHMYRAGGGQNMETFSTTNMLNSQCFNAAVEENPNHKYRSSLSKFASTLRHLQARGQVRNSGENYNNNKTPSTQSNILDSPSHSEICNNFTSNQQDPITYQTLSCSISPSGNPTSPQSSSININSNFSSSGRNSLEAPHTSMRDNVLSPSAGLNQCHRVQSPGSQSIQSPSTGYSPAISPVSPSHQQDSSSSEWRYPTNVSQQHPLQLKSLEFKGHPDKKKYRYNQTALALQQSGLMKTTVKTAELLRKSRLLQQELLKLRRETANFVHSVLSNPENKHLRDSIIAVTSKHQDPVVTSSTT